MKFKNIFDILKLRKDNLSNVFLGSLGKESKMFEDSNKFIDK